MNTRRPTRPKKPFIFRMTKEKLEECHGMSPEAKLEWLEEANRFVDLFLTEDQRTRWREISGAE